MTRRPMSRFFARGEADIARLELAMPLFREATSTGWASVHASVVKQVAAQLGDDERLVRAST